MNAAKPVLPFAAVLLAILPASPRAESPDTSPGNRAPGARVADAQAAAVTERNLLASERFWPYRVELRRPWRPAGRRQPLLPGAAGVLIRVEASGVARIDFGRDGLYEVPVRATDLLQRANRVRRGELEKLLPNFVLAIAPRLLDSGSASPRPFPPAAAAEPRAFLCVFADSGAEGFAELATSLTPLRERHGALTILFPQGQHPDAEVRERLRSLGWTVPFAQDHLAEAYTRSLLAEETPLPALLLQTGEGRVLFRSRWGAGAVGELEAALERAFGGAPATTSVADRE
jgi:hypothetical protein